MLPVRLLSQVSLAAALTAASAFAQSDAPRFWGEVGGVNTSLGVRGVARTDDQFQEIIRLDVGYLDALPPWQQHDFSGADAANFVCDKILELELDPGQVAVMLARFGSADPCNPYEDTVVHLMWHPLDKLPGVCPDKHVFYTPWKTHGVAEAGVWMDDFIATYQARQQQNPLIPDPSRFIFDLEGWDFEIGSAQHWVLLQQDPRWATQPVPGNELPGLSTPPTMAQLYQAANQPPFCNPNFLYDACNKDFRIWFRRVILRATSAALDEAVYSRLRVAFPGVKSAQWEHYSEDGLNPPGEPPFRPREWTFNDPLDSARPAERVGDVRAFSDLHAPVIYGPWPGCQCENGAGGCYCPDLSPPALAAAILRLARYKLETVTRSYGGVAGTSVQPFINLDMGLSSADPVVGNKDLLRRVLAISRAYGVRDFELFAPDYNSQSPSNPLNNLLPWNRFKDCVEQVWGATLTARTVDQGSLLAGDLETLRRSDWNREILLSQGGVVQETLTFDTAFAFGLPSRLRFNLELNPDEIGGEPGIQVQIRDFSDPNIETWQTLTANPPAAFPETTDPAGVRRRILSFEAGPPHTPPTGRYLDANRRVYVRVRYDGGSPSASILPRPDLAQLIAMEPCQADINRNGAVNIEDLFAFLSRFYTYLPCEETERCVADLNYDRLVDQADLDLFLPAFHNGCDRP
jgi:hypothetical protein